MPPIAVGAAVGGGLGLLGSLTGPKEQTSTQTTQMDPAMQRFLQAYRQRALQNLTRVQGGTEFSRAAGGLAGNLGFASETGLGGIEGYFDPYQEEVIGGLQSDFDRQRILGQQRAADVATRAGAFGGSRGAVLEAEGTRAIGETEARTLGQFRSMGFQSAAQMLLGERGRMGQLGLAGLSGLGQVEQQRLAALQSLGGAIGPWQGTTTETQPINRNPFLGLLGGAATGASFGMGMGGAPAGVAPSQYGMNAMPGVRYGMWGM